MIGCTQLIVKLVLQFLLVSDIHNMSDPYLDDFFQRLVYTAALRMAIDRVINNKKLYSNGIPFVQSSGTGKSRLMVELGKDFFVIIITLSDDDPPGSFCK